MILDGAGDLLDALRQSLISGQHFAQLDESSDNENAHLYGTRAMQCCREHRHTMFGESVRQIAPATVP
jgi:hypothetical protein